MAEEISVNPQLARLVARIILESGREEVISLLLDHCSWADLRLVYQRLILERGGRAERTDLSEKLGSDEHIEVLNLAILRREAGILHESIGAPHDQEVWGRVMDRIGRPIDPGKD